MVVGNVVVVVVLLMLLLRLKLGEEREREKTRDGELSEREQRTTDEPTTVWTEQKSAVKGSKRAKESASVFCVCLFVCVRAMILHKLVRFGGKKWGSEI